MYTKKPFLVKNNPHHAYLIEGSRQEALEAVLGYMAEWGIETSGNPDFCHIVLDAFKMEEALYLRDLTAEKSAGGGKKIFLLCVNSITLDAQQALLKIFEEPAAGIHFFLVVPDKNALLQTLISRFHLLPQISPKSDLGEEKQVGEFLKMSPEQRIEFLKNFLRENEEETDLDSNRAKSLRFLNSIEQALYQQALPKAAFNPEIFEHIFKVRHYLRQPGSSVKNLLESLALITPVL